MWESNRAIEWVNVVFRRGGDPESLSILVETLENAERICPVLDSDARLFYPTNKLNAFNVPDEFYAISKGMVMSFACNRRKQVSLESSMESPISIIFQMPKLRWQKLKNA